MVETNNSFLLLVSLRSEKYSSGVAMAVVRTANVVV